MARIYNTRQFLDPRYVDMMNQSVNRRLDTSRQDRANVLGALSKTIGSAATGIGKYLDEEEGKETRRALLGSYGNSDPLKAAAADKFIESGDPSSMLAIDQAEKTFMARQDEETKRRDEELLLKKQLFDNAVENIDTYKNDPEREIAAINTAIEKGIAAKQDVSGLQDMLKEKQAEKEEVEWQSRVAKFEEEKDKQQQDYEKEMKDLTKKIINEQIVRLENIADKDEHNYVLNRLKETAEKHGMLSDIKWPEEKKMSRTIRTPEEEKEYNNFLELKKDIANGLRGPFDPVEQARFDKLSKLKPWESK